KVLRKRVFKNPGAEVKDIGTSQQFEAVIEPLNNPNDVGDRTGVKGGFAVPMLIEKKETRVPEFDEVESNVADVLKQQRAKEQLEQKARDLAASVNSAADLKPAADTA